MSEYQYYEFQAIDRRLSANQMNVLRSYSSRASITATSFINEYSYGSFKGDADAWLQHYFDAYLYAANWGTHVLKLSFPSLLLDAAMARNYGSSASFSVQERGDKVILSFTSDDESDSDWVDAEDLLSSMIAVRAELVRGDLRALYLGWLMRVQSGELNDHDTEPDVPPGLGQLSEAQTSFAEFLRIDVDLVQVAAQTSPALKQVELDPAAVRGWVAELPRDAKDDLLAELVVKADPVVIAALVQRFHKAQGGSQSGASTRRTVRQLLDAAAAWQTTRLRREAEERAREAEQRRRAEALARAKQLKSLVGQEENLWTQVHDLVATKLPKNYDQAVKILIDLRDLASGSKNDDFNRRIEIFRQTHARKPSLMERLEKLGR